MKKYTLPIHLLCKRQCLDKFFNVMRLSTLGLFACAFASYAADMDAQTAKVNITNSRMTIGAFIEQVEKETGYMFVYNKRDVDANRTVSLESGSKSVADCLNRVFDGSGIKYVFDDDYIVLTKRGEKQILSVSQQVGKTVAGMIVDETGLPIIGANVVEKGTTNGTVTDIDGKFSINVSSEDAILIISYIGYIEQQFSVGTQKKWPLVLKEDSQSLDEVVVIGYGTTSAKKMVSAVTSVKGETLQDLPFPSVMSTLQGRAAGVIVQNQGGEPGNTPKISIRGGGNPLYVIDGVISPDGWEFQTIDPNDIESISVLKDAASLAVYGSRAADGIILVKTKEGKKGKRTISYTFNAQYSQPTILPEKIDAYTYASTQNSVAMSEGLGEYYSYSQEELDIIKNQTDPFKYPNTDWYSLGLKNFAPEYRHSLSMTGSQKDVNYYLSLGIFDQGSLYNSDALDYTRYTVRSNLSTLFEEIGLKVSLNMNGAYEKRKNTSFSSGVIWDHLRNRSPLEPAYNENGTLSTIADNPLMEMDARSGYAKNDGVVVNTQLAADWNVPGIKGLSLGAMFNYRLNYSHVKNLTARAPQYNQDGSLLQVTKPKLREEAYFNDYYNVELNAGFMRTFADVHSIDAKAVFTVSENNGSYFWASRRDYLSTNVDQLFAGSSTSMENSGSASEGGRMGLVGRVKYDYDNRYYIEGSFRYDGSDNFAPGHRWGFFPSVALGWDITEEPFFQSLNFDNINLLKLRGSYGQMGTESGVNRFGYLSTYKMVENAICINGELLAGFNEGKLTSPELLSWYTRNSLNYGIDVSFFNHRLKGSVDYFFYVTKGGLVSPNDRYTTPLGASLPQIKSDQEHRREGFEMLLNWSDEINSDFHYSIGTNMTYYNNLYVKNPGEAESTTKNPWKRGIHQTDYYSIALIDNGLYQNVEQILGTPRRLASTETRLGDIAYQDINGDGKIDAEDQVRYGMPSAPHFTYGIDFLFSYKGFTLSGLFYGTGKRHMEFGISGKKCEAFHLRDKYQLDYWREDNIDATFPRLASYASANGSNNQAYSSFWIRNASYLRLKNLTLEYDFKYKLLKNIKWLSACKVNLTGTNLFTISDVSDYWDPETASTQGGYPVQRVYSLGVTVGF